MDAVIYTSDDQEYALLSTILEEEGVTAARDPLDGHGHYDYGYQIVVVAVNGARGMEIACSWTERYRDSQVIWITDDPFFARIAMEKGVHDFIVRPYDSGRFRESVRRAIPKCTGRKIWHFQAKGKKNSRKAMIL